MKETETRGMSDNPSTNAGATRQSVLELRAFDFHPTTRVVAGAGALARLGELARELGATRALVVTDPGLEPAGHPQRALAILQQAGLEAWPFDAVE